MQIWVNFWISKYMGNVGMGKFLKTLPIMVFNIWVNILPMGLARDSGPNAKSG